MSDHVALAVAGGYAPHAAALVHSLAEHAPAAQVHVLHAAGLSRRDHRRLQRTSDRVVLHAITSERVAGLPVRDYFTEAMWYRLLLPELVEADRVLYLDADTIAADDLAPLLAIDLGSSVVAAVDNVRLPWLPDRAADLGLESYFNSGVLLFDLAAMRSAGAAKMIGDFARAQGERLQWPDQDALNVVLGEARLALDPRFNAMNAVLCEPQGAETFGEARVAQAREQPAIRHYEGPDANKPWHRKFSAPHRELYWRHRQATPFRRRFRA